MSECKHCRQLPKRSWHDRPTPWALIVTQDSFAMCNAERLHGEGTRSRRRCDGDAGHRRIRGSLTRRRPDVGYTLRMNQNRPPINAHHEAGHAVFAWRFRVHLQSVWIRPAFLRDAIRTENPWAPMAALSAPGSLKSARIVRFCDARPNRARPFQIW